MEKSENEIQKEIYDTLRNEPYIKILRFVKNGSSRKRRGHKEEDGTGDFILCVCGLYTELEVKKPGGVQSDVQIANFERIVKMGGQYQVVESAHAAYEFIKKIRELQLFRRNK